MTDAARISGDISEALCRMQPSFSPCEVCKQPTSGGVCWDCQHKSDKLLSARAATEATVPQAFGWARFGSALLAARSGPEAHAQARAATDVGRVVLLGPSGSGKTSLAVAMMRARVEVTRQSATLLFACDLATARSRSRLGREADEVIEAAEASLLVLDDLGTDRDLPSSAVVETIFLRHAHARPTWVTTWMTVADMRARYGDGFARRVFEGARIIECAAGR